MIVWCDFNNGQFRSSPIDTTLLNDDLRERVEEAALSGYRHEFCDKADWEELWDSTSKTTRNYPIVVSGHIGACQ